MKNVSIKETLEKSPVLIYLKQRPNQTVTKEELQAVTGWNNRKVRDEISFIANYYPIMSLSGNVGYMLVTWDGTDSVSSLMATRNFLQLQQNEHQSRVDALKKRMRPLIANIKVLDKIISEKEGVVNGN